MPGTALFVVDIQHDLALSSNAVPHASRILAAGTSLLARARSYIDSARARDSISDLSIIVVQHEEPPARGSLQRGTQAWELAFPPRADDGYEILVSKDVRNTFASNPQLAEDLRSKDVHTIVLFGIQSECCVLETSRGALANGFTVVLLRGAHSTYGSAEKTATQIEQEVEDTLLKEGVKITQWESWKP